MNVTENLAFENNMRSRYDGIGVTWVFFVFIYAYAGRLLIVWFAPELVYWTVPQVAWSAFDDPDVKIEAIGLLLVAVAGFCFSLILSWTFASLSLSTTIRPRVIPRTVGQRLIVTLLLTSVALAALLSGVAYIYGIGRQGQFNEQSLPFKLAGMVVYAKTAVLPALLLLQVYWAEASGRRRLARVGALVLIALGLMDMFMLDSRGAAMKHVLLLVLVWWLAGFRLLPLDRTVLLVFLAVLLAAIQMVTSVRLYGEQTAGLSIDQILQGLNFVLLRITGVDQLMVIQYLGSPIPWDEVWDVLTSPRGISGYYTTALLGVDENLPQTFAPSGLGWFYLVGGLPGILIGAAVIGFAATTLWTALDRVFAGCAPVIKSFFLVTLLMIVSEGSMEAPLVSFLITAFSLKLIDLARRALLLKHAEHIYTQGSNV